MMDFVGWSEDVFSIVENVFSGYIIVFFVLVLIERVREYFNDMWNNRILGLEDLIERLLFEVGNEVQESYRLDYVCLVVDVVFVMVIVFNDVFKEKCQSYIFVCDGFWEFLQQNYLQWLKLVDFLYSLLNFILELKELIEMGRRIWFSGLGDYLVIDIMLLYDINVF